jgi:phosphoribosylglycinamide formyltransferase-1
MKTIRLAILGSTRGTDMLPIIAAIADQQLAATIAVVISNKEQAIILERARAHYLPAVFLDPTGLSRVEYDKLIQAELHKYQIDLVILIGYMRILSPALVNEWKNKIINVHPSLLPEFSGGMNNDVHAAVLAAGKSETGCTVHYVTTEVDAGPILLQKRCKVLPDDTVETLKTRVQQLEGAALIETIASFA